MPPILIDTNILIYSIDPGDPEKQRKATEVLHYLEQTQLGCLSVQCLAEFFQVVTTKLKPPILPDITLEHLGYLSQVFTVFSLSKMIIFETGRAVRDYQMAYYDAQIWAVARLNQVPVIFTEDFQDGQILEGVRFINPFLSKFRIEQIRLL